MILKEKTWVQDMAMRFLNFMFVLHWWKLGQTLNHCFCFVLQVFLFPQNCNKKSSDEFLWCLQLPQIWTKTTNVCVCHTKGCTFVHSTITHTVPAAQVMILSSLGTVRICQLLPEHLPGRPNYDQDGHQDYDVWYLTPKVRDIATKGWQDWVSLLVFIDTTY